MTSFSDEFLSENDFETVLVTFCYYDYGVKTSKEKIATDQKDYQKCSLCVIVCCITKNIVSNSKKDWLLGHLRRN